MENGVRRTGSDPHGTTLSLQEQFCRRFGDQPTQAMGEILSAEELRVLVEEEVGGYRDRVYPPLTTLGLFIEQALSPDGACQDAVARHLSERTARGQAGCSLNSGCQRPAYRIHFVTGV